MKQERSQEYLTVEYKEKESVIMINKKLHSLAYLKSLHAALQMLWRPIHSFSQSNLLDEKYEYQQFNSFLVALNGYKEQMISK